MDYGFAQDTRNAVPALMMRSVAPESTVAMEAVGAAPTLSSLKYSTDGGATWYPFTVGSTVVRLQLDEVMLIRNTGMRAPGSSRTDYNRFVLTGGIEVYGELGAMYNGNGYIDMGLGHYSGLFENCKALVSTQDLHFGILGTITQSNYCFCRTFAGCSSLVSAALPTASGDVDAGSGSEFYEMFAGCSSLKTLTGSLKRYRRLYYFTFYGMFSDCSALETAPELPSNATLGTSCYQRMFFGCSSLLSAPALVSTALADSCYASMFAGCTSLAVAPSLPATTLAKACYYLMFSGCTSLEVAPSLPATTLAARCYQKMFSGCTSLAVAPSLPAITLAAQCYQEMLSGCTSLEVAPSLPAITLVTACYSGMFSGCSSLRVVAVGLQDWPSSQSYTNQWLLGVYREDFEFHGGSCLEDSRGTSAIPHNATFFRDFCTYAYGTGTLPSYECLVREPCGVSGEYAQLCYSTMGDDGTGWSCETCDCDCGANRTWIPGFGCSACDPAARETCEAAGGEYDPGTCSCKCACGDMSLIQACWASNGVWSGRDCACRCSEPSHQMGCQCECCDNGDLRMKCEARGGTFDTIRCQCRKYAIT